MADQPDVPDRALPEPSPEDEAWATIVANFGERAQLSPAELTPEPLLSSEPEPLIPEVDPADDWPSEPDEHYVPPAVPEVGLADGPRGAAWLGLLGAPALFMIALLTGISIPGWLSVFAVVAFLVSLGYLFATMRKHDDDEPWNDGAVV